MSIKNTAIAALIFVLFYNFLFFHTGMGVGTGFLFLALNLYFFFIRNKYSKNLTFAIYSSIVGMLFAFLFSYRNNAIVQLINLCAAIFFSLVSLYLYKYSEKVLFQIPEFILLPLLILKDSFQGMLDLFKQDSWSSSESLEKDVTSSLIRGLVITVPVIAVLLFLLTQADPIFSKLTHNLLTNIGERTVVSLIIFIGLMSFGLAKFLEKILDQKEPTSVSIGKSHELTIIAGSVLSLFAVFIIVQFRYLFFAVAEGELNQLGINSLTYSEYVRKGFFELLIASTIASGVIIYVLKFLHHLKDSQKLLVQTLSAILTVETGLLLLSAVKRVALYADTHGLTRARVFGYIFLIWLSVLLAIFLIRIFKEMKREWFFATTLISVLIAFLLINLINIDGLIATKYKPTVNDEIDYFYLTSLSTDAAGSWKNAIEDSTRIINTLEKVDRISTEDNRKLYWTRVTLYRLNDHIGYLNNKYKVIKQWQSINLSEYDAYITITDNMGYFGQIPALINAVNNLDSKVTDDVRRDTPLDRSTQPPLLH